MSISDLAWLLQTADALFPTGAFAHSLGFEESVRLGAVRDEASLGRFLREQSFRAPFHLSKPSWDEHALLVQIVNPTAGVFAGDALRSRVAVESGARWLTERVLSGAWREPAPIGFYFAKLWYSERLYPLIFTAAALGRVAAAK